MASNSSSEDLTALERLTRMFDMGEYGRTLAQQILNQYVKELADDGFVLIQKSVLDYLDSK